MNKHACSENKAHLTVGFFFYFIMSLQRNPGQILDPDCCAARNNWSLHY
jgi:hypothetical protein